MIRITASLLSLLLLSACASAPLGTGAVERGKASWYGPGFHGRRTASGEIFDMNAMTAAHRKLPMNSVVQVRSLTSGNAVTVRINDRGPFGKGRIIDLSYEAAKRLGIVKKGMDEVEVRVESIPGPR